tara:strand:- start:94 stop:432 length:339 start_codon:yes stop_codon:yes gene_type:complete
MAKDRVDRFLDIMRENVRQDNEKIRKKAKDLNKKEAEEEKRKKENIKKEVEKRIKNSPVTKAIGGGSFGGIKPSTILEGKLPGKKKFRIGGHVKKKRIDGIAKKGKTRGTII